MKSRYNFRLSVNSPGMRDGILTEIYRRLLNAYGPQGWWPADGPFEMIAGAILTQAAAWRNVEQALANLRAAGIDDWPAVYRIPIEDLSDLVRPSGYYNAKARKLKAFAAHVCQHYAGDLDAMFGADTDPLRKELLGIYGVGPETADDILVYAAGKPSFVIDAYTIRILSRVGLAPDGHGAYTDWQAMFHAHLPADTQVYNEYHALLDRHHKEACTKNNPRCDGCCLRDMCDYANPAAATPRPG